MDKKTGMRKTKTDAIDAAQLCELFYKEDLEPYRRKSVQIPNFRHLTRQHDALTCSYVEVKLKFQAVLDQVFPGYKKVFGSLYSAVSLKVLLDYPTPEDVCRSNHAELSRSIKDHYHTRSMEWLKRRQEY